MSFQPTAPAPKKKDSVQSNSADLNFLSDLGTATGTAKSSNKTSPSLDDGAAGLFAGMSGSTPAAPAVPPPNHAATTISVPAPKTSSGSGGGGSLLDDLGPSKPADPFANQAPLDLLSGGGPATSSTNNDPFGLNTAPAKP